MAERRMFCKSVVESDAFTCLPFSAQALYIHLCMNADDDGFLNNARRIQRSIGCSEEDLQALIDKRFILTFPSGVIAIKHWRMNNHIRSDRYTPTVYSKEKSSLVIQDDKSYTEKNKKSKAQNSNENNTKEVTSKETCIQVGIPNGYQLDTTWDTNGIPDVNHLGYHLDTQYRLGKVSIDKSTLEIDTTTPIDSPCFCSEVSQDSTPSKPEETEKTEEPVQSQKIFIELPLLKGKTAKISENYCEEMQKLYPAIDVREEIRKAKAWLLNNPKNGKSDWKRFIGGWLSRSQDRARSSEQGQRKLNRTTSNADFENDPEWNNGSSSIW